MIVPFDELSHETLVSVIEDWLSRQSQEWVIEAKNRHVIVSQVIDKLKARELFVTWDDESQTINIVDSDSLPPSDYQ